MSKRWCLWIFLLIFCIGCTTVDSDTTKEIQVLQKEQTILPEAYDARQHGKWALVKNQGSSVNCWAYASLTALELSLRPKWDDTFSVQHMISDWDEWNDQDGGMYTMSMAYLLSWRGPVSQRTNKDVPYHVKEIRILQEQNFEEIKEAVMAFGAVESSFYSSFLEGDLNRSPWYNAQTASYCCMQEHTSNHEIVIIGWDDAYPKENFCVPPKHDGAFLCLNSWGEDFGDQGYFYVSYEDCSIGKDAVVYSSVDRADPSQILYETDSCGWIGQIGYECDTLWYANRYQAVGDGEIEAVGFYVLDSGSRYEVFWVDDWKDVHDFSKKQKVASGNVEWTGFVSVPLSEKQSVKEKDSFAVMVKMVSPTGKAQAAAEFQANGLKKVDISDGEGYISWNGETWERAEESLDCNICLKAYGRNLLPAAS